MKKRSLVIFIPVMVLTGCMRLPSSRPTPDVEILEGLATVEEVEVVMLMSFPLQVHLQVSGYLADPCTGIDEIYTEHEGFTFEVEIRTIRESQVNCIQVIESFEQNIPLEVYGLPAGDYTVHVNGVTAEFTFYQDNLLEE